MADPPRRQSDAAEPDSAEPDGAEPADRAPPSRRGRPPLGGDIQRRRILDAASAIFMTRHFDGTSLDAVAREAGVTKRTIYEMVGDKEALFRAVCNYSSASVASVTFPQVTTDMSLRGVLRALAHTLLAHALEPSRVALSRMIMLESMRFPDLVSEVLEVGRQHMNQRIIAVFDAVARHDMGVVPEPMVAAELFYDIVVGNRAFRATIGFEEETVSANLLERRLGVFIDGFIHDTR